MAASPPSSGGRPARARRSPPQTPPASRGRRWAARTTCSISPRSSCPHSRGASPRTLTLTLNRARTLTLTLALALALTLTLIRRVSPSDAEHLLQLLTVPYLRLPLLLAFFAPQHRVTALAEPALQAMLDAACFEPGLFQPDAPRPMPTQLPALDREVFATPAGLLVNELQHAPTPLLASLLEIGRRDVAEMWPRYRRDMGRYGEIWGDMGEV